MRVFQDGSYFCQQEGALPEKIHGEIWKIREEDTVTVQEKGVISLV
jgi:hypothetical protein